MSFVPDHTVIGSQRVHTLLGVQCWDAADETLVSDGLLIEAWPEDDPRSVTKAFRTRSGIYAFQGLQGLREAEYPLEEASGAIVPAAYVVKVEDLKGRFTPTTVRTTLPATTGGLFQLNCSGSLPEEAVSGVFLFSAPARNVPPGFANVIAQLVEFDTREPAVGAVMEVQLTDGARWIGISDENGQVAVVFPYPRLNVTLSGSFPEGGMPLHQHTWDITIQIRYAPEDVERPLGTDVPELCSVLQQSSGRLYNTEAGGSVASLPALLSFGKETVIRTESTSVLLIESITSTP